MVLVELIGAFIVALSILYIYYKFVIFNFWRKRGVPYVEPVVPTGNIAAVVTGKVHIGKLFHDAYIKYKNHRAFGMYTFFKPNLVIADPDLIQTVLTRQFENFHDRGMYCNEKVDPLSNHLLFMPGKKWRNMRIKMTPAFTLGKIKQMFPIFKECGNVLARHLESKAQLRDSVELKNVLTRYSLDVIMSAAFGIQSNCIEEPYNNDYLVKGKRMFVMHPIWIALFVFAPKIMEFFSIPLVRRHYTNFYMNMFRENVEYRQTYNIVKYDFMNLLIQLMERGHVEPDDNKMTTNMSSPIINKLTMAEAAAQSYAFFQAGFETSSTTMTFALYELAQHQDIQDKVHKEIDEILSKYNDMTYDAINEMTYLHMVINETIRKYPSLPILNRICTKEINLPTTNIRVPKGTSIIIPVLGLHLDPSIYPDPDKFDPERFNTEEVAKRHPYAYLPFGEGPHKCIGMRFGYVQVKVGLVSLLSKYKFKLHPQTRIPPVFNKKAPTLAPKGGILLVIELR